MAVTADNSNPSDQAQEHGDRAVSQPQPLDGLSIIVVDDDASIRILISTFLSMAGARTIPCGNAEEAIAALQRDAVDVVVSDVGMPRVDGYMLIQRVRALAPLACASVKALALTAYAGEKGRERAFAAGFNDHLPKPFAREDLVKAVASLAGRA
jgi:CheY-like chemotaxis protein